MGALSAEIWVLLGGIGCVGVLAVLYTLSETVRCETTRHDVQVRASELKQRYLDQLRGDQPIMEVDEALPEPPETLPVPEPVSEARSDQRQAA
jgi:hypothetical protein